MLCGPGLHEEKSGRMKEKRRNIRMVWIAAGILAALCLAAWLLLFQFNRFTLSIELHGDPEMTLEYGESYQEPGASVRLTGTLFFREGIEPEKAALQVEDAVDAGVTGSYRVTYWAQLYWLRADAQRVVHIVDTQPPVITLAEETREITVEGAVYEEPGYTAHDNYDGDMTGRVLVTHSMGKVTYVAVDSSGNMAYVDRIVPNHDPVPPEITLEGGADYAIPTGKRYYEPGYRASDNVDGDLTAQVAASGMVDWLHPGIYPITYRVTDAYGNERVVTRNVEVTAAPRPATQWPPDKTVYLTFDDGPGPYTERLLDILDQYGVKATFFVVDSEYRYLFKEIVDRGHSIGIHSVTHDYASIYSGPEAYFEDLYTMQQIIYEETGVLTTLMRFPGGSSNTVSCKLSEGIMTYLSEAVRDAGFQYFDWNVDSDDAGKTYTTKNVRRNVLDGIAQTGIALVLQHDVYDYSVNAVEGILRWGLDNGYSFLPLSPDSPGFHHDLNN